MAVAGIDGVTASAVGLPAGTRACLFDLDGVLTDSARLHAAAWKEMFDLYLRRRAERAGTTFVPFDGVDDYNRYVDGRPRLDGVREFLASRSVALPDGGPSDPPGSETLAGLGNEKNEIVLASMFADGVEAFPGSLRYLRRVRENGLRCAVVSSSANCGEMLVSAGIEELFDVRIDALVADREGLRGKPAPDTFLAAAQALEVAPRQAAVFEDALAGVAAARAGGFGYVVGVDRTGQADALRAHGADVVVGDLSELLGLP
jgi:beta-phosphoglucomutase family hydrolase